MINICIGATQQAGLDCRWITKRKHDKQQPTLKTNFICLCFVHCLGPLHQIRSGHLHHNHWCLHAGQFGELPIHRQWVDFSFGRGMRSLEPNGTSRCTLLRITLALQCGCRQAVRFEFNDFQLDRVWARIGRPNRWGDLQCRHEWDHKNSERSRPLSGQTQLVFENHPSHWKLKRMIVTFNQGSVMWASRQKNRYTTTV